MMHGQQNAKLNNYIQLLPERDPTHNQIQKPISYFCLGK